MKNDNEKGTAYNRRYHLQRELKAAVRVHSNRRIIFMPEGKVLSKTDEKRKNILISEFGYVIQPELVDVPVFERVMVARSVGLRGKSINFKKERMFGLLPGTLILQVGKGKNSPVNRIDKFSKPGKYAGTIELDDRTYFAVLMPQEIFPGSDLQHYMLYEPDGQGMLIRRLYHAGGKKDYDRIYLPEFKLAKPIKEKPKSNQGELKF